MKLHSLILVTAALAAASSLHAGTAGSYPAKTTLDGTEKVYLDDGTADKHATIATVWKGMILSGGLTARGSTAYDFSGSTGAFKSSTGLNVFGGSTHSFAGKLFPASDDGAALGDGTHGFSDLFLASGAVLNFNNSNVVLTHSSGILTLSTGDLRIVSANVGTNTNSVPTLSSTSTFTNKTLTAPVLGGTVTGTYTLGGTPTLGSGIAVISPVITTGLTASGSAANTFVGSTGTFITSTGANTLSGAVTINAATTPSLTTASGKTNSGFVLVNGKTSGGLKLLPTDASGFTLTVQNAAIATADRTLTLPDPGGSDSVAYLALAQTLTNKTFVAPVLGAATGTSLAVAAGLTSSGPTGAGIGYASGAGGSVTQATNRTTGVTLSKLSGRITTTASSMAAQTPTTFTVTNTTVAATDVVTVAKVSGDADTQCWVNSVGSGSFTVTLFNTHASAADTTAFVLNYAVIKAVAN
jgi:hypothetical protein